MNRKGDLQLMLSENIGLIVAILFLLLFLTLFFRSCSQGQKIDELKSFNALADEIELLAARDTEFEYTKQLLVLGDDYRIEGYSSHDTYKKESCDDKSKACMCLVKRSTNAEVECRTIDSTKTVLLLTGSRIGESKQTPTYPPSTPPLIYRNLDVKGVPRDHTNPDLSLPAVSLSSGGLFYVEKFVSSSQVIIMVSQISDEIGLRDGEIDLRINALSRCPDEGSAEQCKGALRNSKVSGGFCDYSYSRCLLLQIPDCEENKVSQRECLCGDVKMEPGFMCIKDDAGKNKIVYVDCRKVNECMDYCKL
ncbi:hypothetical protein JW826_02665, partial [Candidatus Woesearchaeota archaeon]|nr:hypothetical protein [Candidatus Woesearchaeota archaeon]